MQFDSPLFFLFLLVVYGVYLVLPFARQNRFLLAASYAFYASWDWRFLGLLWISTAVDYYCGKGIHTSVSQVHGRGLLLLSISVNLGILGCFKYFDFFAAGMTVLLGRFGLAIDPIFLQLILPIGISFYTFQSMGYTIDVYRREVEPCKSPWDFALFVAFFPQLVAGPIERAKRLLPQLQSPRTVGLDDVYAGAFLLAWGLFQKLVIADNVARVVNTTFAGAAPYNGAEVLAASYAFSFQLLCDFAGYSCMAVGAGRLMGFRLTTNFRAPYLATNLRDFWSRWHVSLTRWFGNYVYRTLRNVLGAGTGRAIVCVLLTFVLVGLWHGASWTFVLWGLLAGAQFTLYIVLKPALSKLRPKRNRIAGYLWSSAGMLLVYHLWCLGCPLFRGKSLAQSLEMYGSLVANFHLTPIAVSNFAYVALYTALFLLLEAFQFVHRDILSVFKLPIPIRATLYLVLFYGIAWFGNLNGQDFIYFQF
jgi:D-alanyl-lipoteichoic acid acyltransferase DltB (MBOAT superfamily)